MARGNIEHYRERARTWKQQYRGIAQTNRKLVKELEKAKSEVKTLKRLNAELQAELTEYDENA